jgi:hypothetical protein
MSLVSNFTATFSKNKRFHQLMATVHQAVPFNLFCAVTTSYPLKRLRTRDTKKWLWIQRNGVRSKVIVSCQYSVAAFMWRERNGEMETGQQVRIWNKKRTELNFNPRSCTYSALKCAPSRILSPTAVVHGTRTGPKMNRYGQLKISVCPSLIFGRFLYNMVRSECYISRAF